MNAFESFYSFKMPRSFLVKSKKSSSYNVHRFVDAEPNDKEPSTGKWMMLMHLTVALAGYLLIIRVLCAS